MEQTLTRTSAAVDTRRFRSFDGVELAWHEVGEGAPVVLIHGLFSSAHINWIKYGHAAAIAASGFRVIMPDLRAHGDSAKPHDKASYPPDVLVRDGFALLETLKLTTPMIGGYSLGGRTVARMLAGGLPAERAIISGMGLQGMLDTGRRADFFRHVLRGSGGHPRGSAAFMADAFLKGSGGDPLALLPLLDSFVDSTVEELAGIKVPVLVLAGAEDEDNGPAADLAKVLPNGRYASVPGNHMSAVARPELGRAIADFLRSHP